MQVTQKLALHCHLFASERSVNPWNDSEYNTSAKDAMEEE